MRFRIGLQEWERRYGNREGYFTLNQAENFFRTVKVVLSQVLLIQTAHNLGLNDTTAWEDKQFQRGIHRLAMRLIDDALQAGRIEAVQNSELFIVEVPEDNETIQLLTELARGDKFCDYQETEGLNLFCSAASAHDETALPIILPNGRRVAPTSRPLCAECSLPDTDYMCSHFLHPQVVGLQGAGGPSGIIRREVMDGLCDLNRPEFAEHQKCHAGGNPCWERIVDIDQTPSVEAVPPQAIEQALDDLDVRWRLAFNNRRVVRLAGAADVSILAIACGSRDEFERRLSSLADIMKRFHVPDDLFPEETELPEASQTLRRLELLFESKLAEDELAGIRQAVSTLRSINKLRVGGQHGGEARRKRAQAADALGVPLDGRWGEAWERIRGLAARAFRDIGDATRQVADLRDESSP